MAGQERLTFILCLPACLSALYPLLHASPQPPPQVSESLSPSMNHFKHRQPQVGSGRISAGVGSH